MTEVARAAATELDNDAGQGGQVVLDRLVSLLDLERIEENIFRGVSPPHSPVRVFGGQVAGQALVAAGRTVPPERTVHSLHAYFIRGGDPRVPIVYEVDRIRDGRSFTTRRVVAVQHGKAIFALSASFQKEEQGIEHAERMPDVPAAETLPTVRERIEGYPDLQSLHSRPRPIDIRYVNDPPWVTRGTGSPATRNQVWMRADGTLPDDQLLHVCVLAYASDMTLLDSPLARHGAYWELDKVLGASLDHAMWFHRPFRADEWFLYDTESPSASNARALATGRFFAADGTLIATVVQEGLLRVL
ncbi:acyl-CoA thioesterase II [Amycolatopsis magusensis]|uniref:Acyl-CoA thioesterase-2 n=1 Tax=Amycolatopsis magusensis TaxID=882444 RepID=A0ABS4Q2S7_9PSEU|nr:acyl-CoA thioesterase II [Amycolatopsis magusensis]MBP2185986.1 acyl-CoA thioesterase-2 [Amycolatopsis magusensis]MDI5977757.1 acyl-CoA thioesterase II [Amycolatopsis magusensis]